MMASAGMTRTDCSDRGRQLPRPIVVSGPSGSGKSTLLNRLFKEYPNRFGLSVSHTTRSPRPGEQDGREYHFVTPDAFEGLAASGAFIEHARFSSNRYGTSIASVKGVHDSGRTCILDIELNGVRSMKRLSDPSSTDRMFATRFIFVQPPTLQALRERLTARATETPEALEARLQTAGEAMAYAAEPGAYDLVVVNDDLDRAYAEFKDFILQAGDGY